MWQWHSTCCKILRRFSLKSGKFKIKIEYRNKNWRWRNIFVCSISRFSLFVWMSRVEMMKINMRDFAAISCKSLHWLTECALKLHDKYFVRVCNASERKTAAISFLYSSECVVLKSGFQRSRDSFFSHDCCNLWTLHSYKKLSLSLTRI